MKESIELLLIVLVSALLGYNFRDYTLSRQAKRLFIRCDRHIPTEDEVEKILKMSDEELEEWLKNDRKL